MTLRTRTPRALPLTLLSLLVVLLPGIASAQKFTVIDLGSLGGSASRANGVNSAGVIVGMSLPSGPSAVTRPARWTNLAVEDIGPVGTGQGEAYAINAAGSVVGYARDASSRPRAFLRDSTGVTDVGTLGGLTSYAYAVNAHGDVAGFSSLPGDDTTRAFLRHANGVMENVGVLPGGKNSFAYGVTDSGWVAGQSYNSSGNVHAFLKPPGLTMADLGTLGGSNSAAYAIKPGYGIAVVGSAQTVGNAREPVCVWTWLRHAVNLGTLGGNFGVAYAINSREEVVGASLTAGGETHAFYWYHSGPLYDLNDGIPADSGWVLTEARAVSDNSVIVGWGYRNGEVHAFMLLPDPTVAVGASRGPALAFAGPVPNPMSHNTMLEFDLPSRGTVRLDLYDVQGRHVRTFAGTYPAGHNSIGWDGRDAAGRPVGSGFYWARLQAAGQEQTRGLTVVR